MTTLKILCISFLFFCLFVTCASAQEKTSPTPTPAITVEAKRFESIQGGFAINIYEAPFQTLDLGTETSAKNGVDFGKMYIFKSGKIYFSVMYSDMVDYDGKPVAKPLDEMNTGTRIGILRKQARLISENLSLSVNIGERNSVMFLSKELNLLTETTWSNQKAIN